MRIPLSILAATLLAGLIFNEAIHAAPPAAGGHHDDHSKVRGVLSLDVAASGPVLHLLVGETPGNDAAGAAMLYRRSEDGGKTWSPPVQADAGLPPAHNPHRGSDPQVAAAGGTIVAVWMSKGTGYFDSGPMITALSNDGGRTWQPGPNPADDQSTGGHGFIDVTADGAGTFHLTWLDSRDGKQGLRYARSTDGGKTWSANQTLKAASCECCWNAVATGPDGAVAILFRDSAPRDMNLTLSIDGGNRWRKPVVVGNFGWQFNGCPHVGGGLAFRGSALHAVVWSGIAERTGVHFLTSPDRGGQWSEPRRLGSTTASHPDVAAGVDGRVAAVWDDRAGESGVVCYAESKNGGREWGEPVQLSNDGDGITVTHPRIVPAERGFRVFWTETAGDRPTAWRSALVP